MSKWVEILRPDNSILAHAMCNHLIDEGIQAHVLGEFLETSIGTAGGKVRTLAVLVPETEFERARQIVEACQLRAEDTGTGEATSDDSGTEAGDSAE